VNGLRLGPVSAAFLAFFSFLAFLAASPSSSSSTPSSMAVVSTSSTSASAVAPSRRRVRLPVGRSGWVRAAVFSPPSPAASAVALVAHRTLLRLESGLVSPSLFNV